MSTMEECGVGTLSQTLECREADLAELLEEKDGFEKDIKVSLTIAIQYIYELNEATFSHPFSVAALLRPRGCRKKLLAQKSSVRNRWTTLENAVASAKN
jgi:hypothetical protein